MALDSDPRYPVKRPPSRERSAAVVAIAAAFEIAVVVSLLTFAHSVQRHNAARTSLLLAGLLGSVLVAVAAFTYLDGGRFDTSWLALLAVLLLGLTCALIVIAAYSSDGAPAPPRVNEEAADAETPLECGKRRWSIKTASDPLAPQIPTRAKKRTIAALGALRRPEGLRYTNDSLRAGEAERTVFHIDARLRTAHTLADHDIHVVVSDLGSTSSMVVEIPDVACAGADRSPFRDMIFKARRNFEHACGGLPGRTKKPLGGIARIDGVGFFDTLNHAFGTAPNGLELHPVLRFSSSDCTTG